MNKYKVIQTRNPTYTRARALSPVGVFVHSTGANNPNLSRYVDAVEFLGTNRYNNHWNSESARKSMHGFIGKDKTGTISYIQTLPYNMACWGAGGGRNGSYNYNPHGYLQFEICEDNLKNPIYYHEAFQAAEDICVELCQMHGWTERNITSHYEAAKLGYASNHGDPLHWMKLYGDNMDKFRARVGARLNTKPVTPDYDDYVSDRSILVNITRAENAAYHKVAIGATIKVDFEKYIECVIASEIGNAPLEACKAQAVAARTYALSRVGEGGTISDSSSTAQAYRAPRGAVNSFPNARAAAIATAGQVLFYKGKLVETAVYSDANGGHITSAKDRWGGDRPYLLSKPDPWDFAISKGTKNGHGVGMSQTGAKYAASIGINYKQILSFYYPGTTLVPKFGEGLPEHLDPTAPEAEDMVSMTGKYATITTTKDAGLSIWSDKNKSARLLQIPKGEVIFVMNDPLTGWVLAKKDNTQGYVDRQYLTLVADQEQDEAELEVPPVEEPTIGFEAYSALVITRYDEGLSLWNNTRKNLRLVRVAKGETVNVVDEVDSQWAIAEYRGVRGYIDRRYLQKTKELIEYVVNGLEITVTCKTQDQINRFVGLVEELNR